MGIIAILAGVLAVSAGTAIKAAKRARAAAVASQIQTSILNYYQEYGVYPLPATAANNADYYIHDTSGDEQKWGDLIVALCGNVNPSNPSSSASSPITNSRAISYLSLKKSDVSTKGAPLNPLPPDSTGEPYFFITMDADYDGIIGLTGEASMPDFTSSKTGSMKLTGGTSTAGAAVWANCNDNTTPAKQNPNFYVKTY